MAVQTEEPRAAVSVEADLRSDTVTIPTDDMWTAMRAAHMGDDVYGESETTASLEAHVAALCGKEAGLLTSSGTLGNQLCLRAHLKQPPHSVLCDARAHIVNYEAGGLAVFSQAMPTCVQPQNGRHLTADEVEAHLITGGDVHFADTAVVELENTINGVVFPLDEIARISELVRGHGIAMHLDGARLWEASAATGLSLREYGKHFDSMSLCMSKGLGAPFGTVIVGDAGFIRKARHLRKMMGGGLRQIGLMAGAARHALDDVYPKKLKIVHERARRVADRAVELGFKLVYPADTNMVWLDLKAAGIDADDFIGRGAELGLKLSGGRLVFHHQTSDRGETLALQLLEQVATAKKLTSQ